MDIMLDLETMGVGSNAAIIAIGAVSFDINGVNSQFYEKVNLESSVKCGGEIDPSTVMWWMSQSDDARNVFLDEGDSVDLSNALLRFSAWCVEENVENVWGCGSTFDNVIISNAFARCRIEKPWPFWSDRCYRTVRDMFPNVPFERFGTHHNALDDARTQAIHLVKILNSLGGV